MYFAFEDLSYSIWVRATAIADKLGIEFALIHRQKDGRTEKEKMDLLVGDVKDKVSVIADSNRVTSNAATKVVILVDDMIDTGATLSMATKLLHDNGAKSIFCLVSHGKRIRHCSIA